MFENPMVLMAFVFVACSAGVYALVALMDPYWHRVHSRIGEMEENGGAQKVGTRDKSGTGPAGSAQPIGVTRYLTPFGADERSGLQKRLAKAGIYEPDALSRLLIAKLLLMVVPLLVSIGLGITGRLGMEMALVVGIVSAGIGSLLPGVWLDRAVARHHLLLQRSLPDFLDVMIVCLEGGLSLQETIRRVSDELQLAHPALAFELGVVQRDVELGTSVDQALRRFATRTDYEGVRSLSTFIREAQRFGTNITEALRNHADMLRSQREQAAEENAQKASVKILLPTLLLIFPAIFIVLVGPAIIQIQEAFAAK